MDIVESIAYLTTPLGVKIQVLNEEQNDWDEVATNQAYNQYIAEHPEELPAKKLFGIF